MNGEEIQIQSQNGLTIKQAKTMILIHYKHELNTKIEIIPFQNVYYKLKK